MAVLWTRDQVVEATAGTGDGDFAATGVSIDSRTVAKGDLFIAIVGPNFDGHEFVEDALAKGAAGAVIARPTASGDAETRPLVMVEDTLQALIALGAVGRARARSKVIGITGSVGKTGTKQMTALALSALGSVHASAGSFNNQFGLPLTLARLDPATDFAVIEMGMNHAGELAELTRIARPDVALITTVEAVHIEFFESVDRIADAKAEIFEGVPEGGAAVLNRDNPNYRQLVAAAQKQNIDRIISFGALPDSEVRLCAYEAGSGGNRVDVAIGDRDLSFKLGVDGKHWAQNSLGVLGVVHALGGDVAKAAAALADMQAPEGRGARHHLALPAGSVELIDDSYNASPASMRAAFALLDDIAPAAGGRRVAILGDMLELGDQARDLHAGLADDLAHSKVDLVFTAGPLMAALYEALPAARRGTHAGSADTLIQPLIGSLGAGDVVLVKGSHGSAMHRVVAALKASARDLAGNAQGGDWPLTANGDG